MMEKDAAPPSDTAEVTTPNSPPQPSTPQPERSNQKHQEEFAASIDRTIIPPKSPLRLPTSISTNPSPPSSSAPPSADDLTAEQRLQHARLVLEYSELRDCCELYIERLRSLTLEIGQLHQENADLRDSNNKILSLIRSASSSSDSAASDRNSCRKILADLEPNRSEWRDNTNRTSLPKSISVRSSGYLRLNQQQSQKATRTQPTSGLVQQRVRVVASEKGEKEAVELEVFRQGMYKTELCEKWQETGGCSYGDQCQFAHGVGELRPVIRHPRYKTEVCRMIVAGASCPYGHRCHFRHSLTEQEQMLLSR